MNNPRDLEYVPAVKRDDYDAEWQAKRAAVNIEGQEKLFVD